MAGYLDGTRCALALCRARLFWTVAVRRSCVCLRQMRGPLMSGTRVTAPTSSIVGDECSWTLQLYVADDQPALTSCSSLTCALGTTAAVPLTACAQATIASATGACENVMVQSLHVPSSGRDTSRGATPSIYQGDKEFQPSQDSKPRFFGTMHCAPSILTRSIAGISLIPRLTQLALRAFAKPITPKL